RPGKLHSTAERVHFVDIREQVVERPAPGATGDTSVDGAVLDVYRGGGFHLAAHERVGRAAVSRCGAGVPHGVLDDFRAGERGAQFGQEGGEVFAPAFIADRLARDAADGRLPFAGEVTHVRPHIDVVHEHASVAVGDDRPR